MKYQTLYVVTYEAYGNFYSYLEQTEPPVREVHPTGQVVQCIPVTVPVSDDE